MGSTIEARGDVFISGGTFINGYNVDAATQAALDKLQEYGALNAIHTSSDVENQEVCVPGTRRVTLESLQSLCRQPDSPDIIWLSGPVGAGKSAIMRTMARVLANQRRLLASFFFFRSGEKRNEWSRFVPTLSFQISMTPPVTPALVASAISQNPAVFTQTCRRQSHTLLESPILSAIANSGRQLPSDQPCAAVDDDLDEGPSLSQQSKITNPGLQWSASRPCVIIVDGLDECTDLNQQVEIIKTMSHLASTIRSQTKHRIKIIVASRPEHHIQTEFNAQVSTGHATAISLDESDANIAVFYDIRLDHLRSRHSLEPTWPSLDEIRWLVGQTGGNYAFGDMSMRFLAGGDPQERLRILQAKSPIGIHQPYRTLDFLYSTVFSQIPHETQLSALFFLRTIADKNWDRDYNPILERILQLPSHFIQRIATYLSSLVDFGTLRPHHASLYDFLADPTRSLEYSLFVEPHVLSDRVVRGTLSIFTPDPLRNPITPQEYSLLYRWLQYCPKFLAAATDESRLSGRELSALLRPIDLVHADLWTLGLYSSMRSYLRRSHYRLSFLYATGAVKLANHGSPESIAIARFAPYTRGVQGKVEILFLGLVLMLCFAHPSPPVSATQPLARFVQHIGSKSSHLARVDVDEGWNFLKTILPIFAEGQKVPSIWHNFRALGIHAHPEFGLGSKYILQAVEMMLSGEWDHAETAGISDCKQSYSGPGSIVQCSDCLRALEELRHSVVRIWVALPSLSLPPPTAATLMTMFAFIKQSTLAWRDKQLLYHFALIGMRVQNPEKHVQDAIQEVTQRDAELA